MPDQVHAHGAAASQRPCQSRDSYDPDIELLRGEFIGFNGGADFYAADVEGLKLEGEISLKVFLEACRKDGVEPFKAFSGKFNLQTINFLLSQNAPAEQGA